jgi:FkbM family methyltransferase
MTLFKKLITNVLPPTLLFSLKKRYYTYTVPSFWEQDVVPIKYLVKPGDFVLDIGANVGWYTAILSKLVGEQGMVYSIEPIQNTFQLLSFVIGKLQLKNVELLNYAISEIDGSAIMEIPLHDYGGPNFYQARIISHERFGNQLQEHKVHLKSIDSLFFESQSIFTFIKCDVEGHELSVIKGASCFLHQSKPAWLVEVSGNPDDDRSHSWELFNILRELNYAAYWFDGQKLRKRSPGDKSVNYFFLQPCHLAQLTSLI